MEKLEITDDSKLESNESKSQISYCVRLNRTIYYKINDHITIIKRLSNRFLSKNKWIEDAIKEKLEREKILPPEQIREKTVTFSIDRSLNNDIEQRVNFLKSIHNSFSKRKWFEEAFFEKLERDRHKSQELIEKMASLAKIKK
ncbi:conserved hypothetical protein (plasmid) [Candidatus Protochlamydia naegleriophila]|uniref:Uncharacterized protein n=1 Tax=Candidatus Protochlamydia naegleriophila TaxID=389348 RepID=A0A0U5JJM7_9BACT|nr:hypothetical protein [Candidatus Protochlamydia naegleriophila]CUI18213.1 conserved hypothetical protein [Candidatus Protochlamydia naegleriophila]